MNRKQAREQAFIFMFEKLFNPELSYEEMSELAQKSRFFETDDYTKEIYEKSVEYADTADEIINKYAKGWKTTRLAKVTLCILRLAIAEIMCVESVPDAVSASEAVELAKKYAAPSDAQFINGILGSVIRNKEQA